MSFALVKSTLQTSEAQALNWRMSLDAWAEDQRMMADKVALFRRYAEGDHDAELTTEMAALLRVRSSTSSTLDRFNDNYMDIIIQTEADRLVVDHIDADSDAANQWITELLTANRLDGMQANVHEAALRDGSTFVMASWDETERRVKLTHEPAYDGVSGMMFVPSPTGEVLIAIKIWQETQERIGDTTRVNVYYPDHVEKYVGMHGGGLRPVEDGDTGRFPWTWRNGPIGMPVIHFPNRGSTYSPHGLSEIENAIPLQNALNRTLTSMVATAEMTGFGLRFAVGWDPPPKIAPGMWIKISKDRPLNSDEKIDIGMMEQGEIVPYIQQAEWLTAEMGKITRTPAPEFMGSSASSGEALKQREIGLLGKVQRFQVKAGNCWEDVIKLAWRVQAAFGSTPPELGTVNCIWKPGEVRNDTEVIANAQVLAEMGFVEEALRQMAPVFEWDEKKIQALIDEKNAGMVNRLGMLTGLNNQPNFENFAAPVEIPAA